MNKLQGFGNNDIMNTYRKSDNILGDIENIIETTQKQAYRVVNNVLTQRNWFIGYRISEEIIGETERSEYGSEIIKKLAKEPYFQIWKRLRQKQFIQLS